MTLINHFTRQMALTMIGLGLTGCLMPATGWAQAAPSDPVSKVVIAAPSANINVTPRRVVFDSTKRTEAVYVFNQGTAAVTVDVALVDNVMLPSGEIVPLDKLEQRSPTDRAVAQRLNSARELILASPSRVTLPPGKGRTIRLRAGSPGATAGAELRTHLAVTTVPSADTGLTAQAAAAPSPRELGFKIQSVFGISIPLILRNGPVDASATIANMKIATIDAPVGAGGELQRVPALTFDLARIGANSIFGNIEVKLKTKKSNDIIGFVRGLAVYPEISSRRVAVPLTRLPQAGETVSVTFISDDPQLANLRSAGTMIVP